MGYKKRTITLTLHSQHLVFTNISFMDFIVDIRCSFIHIRIHIISIISYASISIVFLIVQPLLVQPYGTNINYVIMMIAIGAMIIFNAARLRYFLVNPKEV